MTTLLIKFDGINVRLIEENDDIKMSDYYQRNITHLKKWEPTRDEIYFTQTGWKQVIANTQQLQTHGMYFSFVIEDVKTKVVVGAINYYNIIKFPFYSCHVGYSLDKRYQGKAIMRQALHATNQWMFSEQGIHRIMAAYMPDNKQSAKVLNTTGFKSEGIARSYILINGQWEDHILMALINPHPQTNETNHSIKV